jgi:N-methylhydantoinase B
MLLANVRTPDMRRGDLAAQLAACEIGAERYRELADRLHPDWLAAAARDLLDYAERRTRAALAARVRAGRYEAADVMESDGTGAEPLVVRVVVEVRDGTLSVDFRGTAEAAAGNVNCPLAVTRSAALFVLRCLVGEDVPTNGGMHRVLTLHAPEGSLVNAPWPRAVAAGNVETSQRLVDLLFKALADAADVPAQGQGTMNNVVLGGAGWTYYETIGGGQGASARGPGPSAVHVGMSNTRNTPIEVFELEHPLRIVTYALRGGSGGRGEHAGGDGVMRAFEALEPVDASLIGERRRTAPAGAHGGQEGLPGRNRLNDSELGGRASVRLERGDVLWIETPGGGGWGAPPR